MTDIDMILKTHRLDYTGKPGGLYMCQGEEWSDWVREHGTGLELGAYKYEVELLPDAKLYVVDCVEAVLQLDEMARGLNGPDWATLAAKGYDGIEVRNYAQLRNASLFMGSRFLWLWALDVECVCLWNAAKAVAALRPCK
jgi:hypothetical protein